MKRNNSKIESKNQELNDLYQVENPKRNFEFQDQLRFLYRPEFDQWLRSFGLVSKWETHEDCEVPHIFHGYRPNPSSISYCLKSAFYPSNETLNVWTHFFPFLFMLWRTFHVNLSLENPYEEITHPFWIQSFGICAVLFASTFAHLFCCHSAAGQEFCFSFDYTVITVYGFSTIIASDHYLCPCRCYVFQFDYAPHFYVLLMLFVNGLVAYMTCISRHPDVGLNSVARYGPNALCFVLSALPCIIRFYIYGSNQYGKQTNLPTCCIVNDKFEDLFLIQCFVFLLALLFVGLRLPERFQAGVFDIVGSSHQWFHIFVAIGMYLQHTMTESAMKEVLRMRNHRLLDEDSLHISVWSTFIPLIFLLFLVPFLVHRTVINYAPIVKKNRQTKNSS